MYMLLYIVFYISWYNSALFQGLSLMFILFLFSFSHFLPLFEVWNKLSKLNYIIFIIRAYFSDDEYSLEMAYLIKQYFISHSYLNQCAKYT